MELASTSDLGLSHLKAMNESRAVGIIIMIMTKAQFFRHSGRVRVRYVIVQGGRPHGLVSATAFLLLLVLLSSQGGRCYRSGWELSHQRV